ncbi:MAG: transposase, partial [Proteobacteria bacterium]|nr:transposase [Pseudomonadota bacterium]
NPGWLRDNQERIEDRLFSARRGQARPELLLCDVTPGYLEGEKYDQADYGYRRDKKRGKPFVIGLLCDEADEPVSTEVFEGYTIDPVRFQSRAKRRLNILASRG